MADRIYDTETRQNIRIKRAIQLGIKENPKRFKIPFGKVLIKRGNTYRLLTTKEATTEFKNGVFQLSDVIGAFDFNIDKGNITLPKKILKRDETLIKREKENGNIFRYVLNNNDKKDFYALYKFLRQNNITGTGNFMISRNGRIVFDKYLDIQPTLNKWWKNGGWMTGMIDSDAHIWTDIDESVYKNRRVKTARPIKLYDIENVAGNKKLIIKDEFDTRHYKEEHKKTVYVFYFSKDENITPNKIYQTFRDNNYNTCFFNCIETYFKDTEDKNANTILNKVLKLKEEYKNGVPQNDVQKIVNHLKLNIQINDIFNNKFLEYRPDGKSKAIATIKYINSRCDHLELNNLCDDSNNVKELDTYQELRQIIFNKFNKGLLCYYSGTINEPRGVFTDDNTYKYNNIDNKIIKEFNDSIKINDFSINYNKNEMLCEWLRDGINYNSHCMFIDNFNEYCNNKLNINNDIEYMETLENDDNYKEYDMKKAYTQYKKCSYYMGFPNNMTPIVDCTNFTINDIKKYIGYYKIKIISIKNDNIKKILNVMGIITDKIYIFSSPELLFFNDNGVEFIIYSGSYSFKPFKFDLTEEMIDKKLYAKWAGKLNSLNINKVFRTRCEKVMAGELATRYENIKINEGITDNYKTEKEEEEDKEKIKNGDDKNSPVDNYFLNSVDCIISHKNNKVNYLGHIGGFITAYTRINVLKHLFKIDYTNIIGFKLDGFIIKGNHDFKEDNDIWTEKEKTVNFNWSNNIFNDVDLFEFEKEFKPVNNLNKSMFKKQINNNNNLWLNRVNFLSGAGGCGKSYSVLKKCSDAMYITASWKLAVDQANIYNISCLSYHQFLGIECEGYLKYNKIPSIIFIDEATQIDKKHIKEIIKLCPYSIIFIAGDIDENGDYYQCPFPKVNIIDSFKNMGFIKYTHNYRCKDDILLEKLNSLREYMKETDFNNESIKKYVLENFKDRITTEQFLKDTYNYKFDWVLCSTTNNDDSQTKYYTNLLKGEKYLCVNHNRNDIYKKLNGQKADLKGEILYNIIEPTKKYEIRHAFSIHSFQGITIKNPSRLFIDTNKIFCSRQLYTALSRVERIEQIFLL